MKIADDLYVKTSETVYCENYCFWSFSAKSISWVPYDSDLGKKEHLLETVGTYDESLCYPNEFRFDIQTRELTSLVLEVPENTLPKESLSQLESLFGLVNLGMPQGIRLLDDSFSRNIRLSLAEYIHYRHADDSLYGVTSLLLESDVKPEFVYLDSNLILIFIDDMLAGWVFLNASINLGLDALNPAEHKKDNSLIVQNFYSIFSSENQEKMMDEDEIVKKKLVEFLSQISADEYDVDARLSDDISALLTNSLDFYYG
jgi:hypothetical protein